MDPETIKIPAPLFNMLIVIGIISLFIWFLKALKSFYISLKLRTGILTGNIVLINGLGSHVSFFDEVINLHAIFLSNIRQQERTFQTHDPGTKNTQLSEASFPTYS